jgi:ubiquinol-cytochrome c reductase iron-sulfur subunit
MERYPLASRDIEEAYEVSADRPSDIEGLTRPAPEEAQDPPPLTQRLSRVERRTSFTITVLFSLSVCGSIAFCVAYVVMPIHSNYGLQQNLALGLSFATTMLGLAFGMTAMAKKLAPAVHAVQHREPHHSPEHDEHAAEEQLIGGTAEIGLTQRRVMRRSMLAALGLLPLPFIFGWRDTGPRPKDLLRRNVWKPHDRLVDRDSGKPIKLGDIEVGGVVSVMPEGKTDTTKPIYAESLVALIRLPPGLNKPLPGRANWATHDHVAYSRICTHAGCPVGLYQTRNHILVCPCHQSTFDVPHGCKVLFGPAGRPLPQLPIYVDDDGYFRARVVRRRAWP